MNKMIISMILFFSALLILSSCGADREPYIAKLPTPEPTAVPTAAPTPVPTAEPTAAGTANARARQTEPPEGFVPERMPEYLEDGYYSRYSCAIGGYTFVIRMGADAMELIRIKPGKSESSFVGLALEPFQGVVEDGFFVCSWDFPLDSADPLLPLDHLFFVDAETFVPEDLGEALHYCVQTDKYLVGMTEEPTSESGKANYTLWRFDLKSHERRELCSFCAEEGMGFYGKRFGGNAVYFTFLKGYVSTDFGIYRLDIESGETEKLADHGLPYGVDEDGVLLFVDYFNDKPYVH